MPSFTCTLVLKSIGVIYCVRNMLRSFIQVRYTWPLLLLSICLCLDGVTGNLTCYSCTQVNHHEGCNLNSEVCSGVDQVCLTKVEKLDSIGKVYTKGCMLSRTCRGLEGLNREYLCERYPSTCFYCCSGYLCNQYNTAINQNESVTYLWLLLGIANLVFAFR